MKLGWELIQKLLGDWLGISPLVVSDCFSITCFLVVVVWLPFLIHLLKSLYLNPQIFMLCPSDSLAHPTGRGSEQAAVWC